MDEFSVRGYDVEQLIGFGGSGEVWRAREQATGDVVALKRLRRIDAEGAAQGSAPSDTVVPKIPAPLSKQRLQREAALLASVRHEHVVRLRGVVQADAELVLVLDFAEGGSLASVLGVRGRLSPGEVVTIGAPLAQALSDVHGRGLTHGDVTPANILFDASGKPLLADLGVARLAGERGAVVAGTPGFADPGQLAGRSATPAADVHGLAAVCYAALAGVAPYGESPRPRPLAALVRGLPAALVDAVEAGLDPDPRARPDAVAFARALYASCTPEPVRLVGDGRTVGADVPKTHVRPAPMVTTDTAPSSAGRHRPRRRGRRLPVRAAVAAVCGLALLALAVVVGVGWASHDRSASASVQPTPATDPSANSVASASVVASARAVASSPAPASPAVVSGDAHWARVLATLDAARDQAFVDADPAELDGVYVTTSPALAVDRRTMHELVAAGEHARNLAMQLRSVGVVSQTPTSVVLKVGDVLPDYDVVRADGSVERQTGRGERDWIVTLRATTATGAWRIDTIAPG